MSLYSTFVPESGKVSESALVSALAYCLKSHECFWEPFHAVAEGLGISIPFQDVVKQEDSGGGVRLDLGLYDGSGALWFIVEAKVGAVLTASQPLGYLDRLAPDRSGVLMFIVPWWRLDDVWVRAAGDLPQSGWELTRVDAYDVRAVRSVSGRKSLVLMEWQALAEAFGVGWWKYIDAVGYRPGFGNPDDEALEQARQDIEDFSRMARYV